MQGWPTAVSASFIAFRERDRSDTHCIIDPLSRRRATFAQDPLGQTAASFHMLYIVHQLQGLEKVYCLVHARVQNISRLAHRSFDMNGGGAVRFNKAIQTATVDVGTESCK